MATGTTRVGSSPIDPNYGHEPTGSQPASGQRTRPSFTKCSFLGGLRERREAGYEGARHCGPRLFAELPTKAANAAKRFAHSRLTQRAVTLELSAMFPEIAAARGLGAVVFRALSLIQRLAESALRNVFGPPPFAANHQPAEHLGSQFFTHSFNPTEYGAPPKPASRPPGAAPYGPPPSFMNASTPTASAPPPPPRPGAQSAHARGGAGARPANPSASQNARHTAPDTSVPPPVPPKVNPTGPSGTPPPPRFGSGTGTVPRRPSAAAPNSGSDAPPRPPRFGTRPPGPGNAGASRPQTQPRNPWDSMDGGLPFGGMRETPPKQSNSSAGTSQQRLTADSARPQTQSSADKLASTEKPAAEKPDTEKTSGALDAEAIVTTLNSRKDKPWHEVLGVSQDADQKTIETRYQSWRGEMSKIKQPRREDLTDAKEILRAAFDKGMQGLAYPAVQRLKKLAARFADESVDVDLAFHRKVLGVSDKATPADITREYRSINRLVTRVVQNNSDSNDETTQNIQKMLNSARDALEKDAEKRAEDDTA